MKILALISSIFIYSFAISQNTEGGTNWQNKKEFLAAEPNVIENIKWLETTPFTEDEEDRQEVFEYVMIWLIGCPYLKVTMDFKYESRLAGDKDYEYAQVIAQMFLLGKSLYMIEHKEEKKKTMDINSNVRGIESMITIYNEIVTIKGEVAQHKIMEKYVKLQNENKLEEFVISGRNI